MGLAEQDQPERRRVDAAVVHRERQLAGAGHLAGPDLVQDLARLGVGPRVVDDRLASRQDLEGGHGQVGSEGDRLVGRDDRVAAEQGGEPGHAGGEVVLARPGTVVEQEPEVGHAALDQPVEQLVVRSDGGHPCPPGVVVGRRQRFIGHRRQAGVDVHVQVGPIRVRLDRGFVRPDGPAALDPLTGPDLEPPAQDQSGTRLSLSGRQVARREHLGVAERDLGPAQDPIPADRPEGHPLRGHGDRQRSSFCLAGVAADLEDVGRVDAQGQVDRDQLGMVGEVGHRQPLAQARADDPLAGEAERLAGERGAGCDLVAGVAPDLGVGQLDRAPEVLVDVAAEEGRPGAVDMKDRTGQDPGVADIEPQTARVAVDVAERIGQQEQAAGLEYTDPAEVGRMDDQPLGRGDPAERSVDGRHASSLPSRPAAAATM